MNREQDHLAYSAALKGLANALPSASGADADLIALCHQYLCLHMERDRFWSETGEPADVRYREAYSDNPSGNEEARVQSGLAAAEEQDAILFHQVEALFVQIVTSQATTLEGFLAKALCAQCLTSDSTGLAREVAMRLERSDPSPSTLALSVARDLIDTARRNAGPQQA